MASSSVTKWILPVLLTLVALMIIYKVFPTVVVDLSNETLFRSNGTGSGSTIPTSSVLFLAVAGIVVVVGVFTMLLKKFGLASK